MASYLRPFFKIKSFNSTGDQIKFKSFTKYSLFLFGILHLNFKPIKEGVSLKDKVVRSAKLIYYIFCLVNHALAVVSILVYTAVHSDSFEAASITFTNFLFMMLIGLKSLATFVRREDIWEIFQEIELIQERARDLSRKYDSKKFLDEYRLYMKLYSAPCIISFLPLFIPFILYFTMDVMELPTPFWFPFDIYQPKVFPIVLTWTYYVSFNTDVFLLAVDMFLYALLTVIIMEFHNLKIVLMAIGLTPRERRARRFKELIDHHNKLLNLCDRMQEIFAPIFLATITISSLILCSILFQLSIMDINLAAIGFFVTYLLIMGGQSFLLCVYGQKLMNASESVADGIYDCGWEDFAGTDFKMNIALIIQRGQKAKRLAAMSFANISLESYTTVSLASSPNINFNC